MMNALSLLFVGAWLLLVPGTLHAQGLNADRLRDTSLGRPFGGRQLGAAFGFRHDHAFAVRDPGTRREDLWAMTTVRFSAPRTDTTLGLYANLQNVGRSTSAAHGTEFLRWGAPELSAFMLVGVRVGELGLRVGAVHSFDTVCNERESVEACGRAFRASAEASRSRPIDFIQLLPSTTGVRTSAHYRVDYGLFFAQLDAGVDTRKPNADANSAIRSGFIARAGLSLGIGTGRWGLTYDMANVWAQSRLFEYALDDTYEPSDAEDRDPSGTRARKVGSAWGTNRTRNHGFWHANSHAFALQMHHRHWSYYGGFGIMAGHRNATTVTLGVDYAF